MTLKELIVSLCSLMTVSGCERQASDAVGALVGGAFDEHRVDALGNHLFIKKCGRPNAPKILIDTHFDEIGMMVTGIKEGGFVTVTNVGGVDTRILPAGEVILYGKRPVYGVFAAKAPHLMTEADRDKLLPIGELLIDTGYPKEELEEICPIGTPVGFKPVYREMANDRLSGKAFDNKACAACAVFGVDSVQRRELAGDVYLLLSAFEELGGAGARVAGFGIRPDYALVIDVTHATVPEVKDVPLSPMGRGVDIAVATITDRRLTRMTEAACRAAGVPYTISACAGSTGTNANVLGIAADGIPTALLSLPIKNMHSATEVLALDDACALADAVGAFVKSLEIAEVFGK